MFEVLILGRHVVGAAVVAGMYAACIVVGG